MIRALLANVAAALTILALAAFLVGPVLAAPCKGQTGVASYYGSAHQGRTMANGQPFNMNALTAAMWDVPFGTKYRVTYGSKSVVVTISDRGPAKRLNRAIDLSKAAFAKLAHPDVGIIKVCIERVG